MFVSKRCAQKKHEESSPKVSILPENDMVRVQHVRFCHILQVHDGQVDALWHDGKGLLSGGADGVVAVIDARLKVQRRIDLSKLDSYNPAVRSVCRSASGSKILVGTVGSELYELSASSGVNNFNGPIVEGHAAAPDAAAEQLWGLAINPDPTRQQYCTAGDDGNLRVWCLKERRCLWVEHLDEARRRCTPCSTNPNAGTNPDTTLARQGRRDAASPPPSTPPQLTHFQP